MVGVLVCVAINEARVNALGVVIAPHALLFIYLDMLYRRK